MSAFAFNEIVTTTINGQPVTAFFFGCVIDASGQPTGEVMLAPCGDGKAHPTIKVKAEEVHSVKH